MEEEKIFYLTATCITNISYDFFRGEIYELMIKKRTENDFIKGCFSIYNTKEDGACRFDSVEEFLEYFEF